MSLTKKERDMWDSPQQRYRKFHSYPGLFPNNWRKIFKVLCTSFRTYQHIVGHRLGFHDQTEQ